MKNGFEVYDFKEEDELPELAAGKFLSKLKNPNNNNNNDNTLDQDTNPAIFRHEFLQHVAQGSDVRKKELGCLPCIDVDAIECELSHDIATTHASSEMVREDLASTEGNSGVDAASQLNSLQYEQNPYSKIDNCDSKSSFSDLEARMSCPEASSLEKSQLNCALSASPSNSEPIDTKSEAGESMNESSPSSPVPNIVEDDVVLNSHSSNNCFSDLERDDINIAVDYVVHRNNYCTGCLVSFSSGGIKINALTPYGDQGTFSFEREVDDVIQIESRHLQRFETVMVKLRILSKDALPADDAYGTSGIEELEFAVVEPNWSGKWEDITSLNVKYSALWVHVGMNVAVDGGADFLRQRPYFPNFAEAFEDVIYPKGDSDAVSISKRDVDLLQPEIFINDTIIDFYIKYLKNQIPPEEKHRFHFFNSFFFRKLADLDKDPSSASDGRAAFLRVHKWTRKVDLFGRDYVFIPVNFNLHWSLLVICHPGEVAGFKGENSEKSPRVPCILHMDSIKGTHAGLKNLVQSYLWEEWKVRQKETSEDLSSKFLNLRFVPLELPQQENSFDCGLFLLHYLELFLVEAPVDFSPFRINEFSKFLNVDWFPSVEASLKRTLIQRLISELLENRSREVSSDECIDEPEYNFSENNQNESEVELVPETCTPPIAYQGNLPSSEAGQGIEMTLLEASSMRTSQCVNDSGLVLREFFTPGVTAGSLLAQCSSFDQPSSYFRLNGSMAQIEDDVETGQQFVYFPSGENVFQQINGMTPQAGSIPCSLRGFGADASWNAGISMQGEDVSSSETSICESADSDVGIIENCPVEEHIGLCQKEKIDQQRSPSMENMECLTESFASASSEMPEVSAIEGTEGHDKMQDGIENGSLTPSLENPTTSLHKDPNTVENGMHQDMEKAEINCDDVQTTDDHDVVTESDEQQAAKRRRLTFPLEGEEGLNGSLSKDLHL